MKFKATRPRNRWQDEVSEDGSIDGREEWQGKVYDREEWKKLLRTACNHCILHMPMECMNILLLCITWCTTYT
jgi:beta-xylosidase